MSYIGFSHFGIRYNNRVDTDKLDELLQYIGMKKTMIFEGATEYDDWFWITDCICRNGIKDKFNETKDLHFAFTLNDKIQIDNVYKKALELGFKCNGSPGKRYGIIYSTFILDSNDNNIEFNYIPNKMIFNGFTWIKHFFVKDNK